MAFLSNFSKTGTGDQGIVQLHTYVHTYLIYTGQILTKRSKYLYKLHCQMQEEIHVQKIQNKEKIKCYEKKDMI